MQENKIISIIVPVYNIERYLPQCLESILEQTYRDLEIILVDDGSTDASGDICEQYAQYDNRIIVIHQKNSGAASAKNAGLRLAREKYLTFVDSDDYLEPDAYAYMVSQLESCDADVIQCNFRNVYVGFSEIPNNDSDRRIYSTVEYLRRFTIDWTCGLLWNKLYERRLFNNILFEEGHKIDDEYFTYQGMMNAHRIVVSPKVMYNYRKRKSSVMLAESSQQQIVLDKLDYLQKRRMKIIAKFPELKHDFDFHFLNMLIILSKDHSATYESIEYTKYLLREYFRKGKKCKIGLNLWIQLIGLMYKKSKKILKKKQMDISDKDYESYFE